MNELTRVTPPSPLTALTPRQREVAALVAAGYSNREIARRLFIDEMTVKNHLTSSYGKLALPNGRYSPRMLLARLVWEQEVAA